MSNELIRQAIALLQQAVGSDTANERGPVVDADGVYRPAWLSAVRKTVFDKYPAGYTSGDGATRVDPRTGAVVPVLGERIDFPTGFYWKNAPGLTEQQITSIDQNLAVQAFAFLGGPFLVGAHWYDVSSSMGGLIKTRVRGKALPGVWLVNTPSYQMLDSESALEEYFKEHISNLWKVDL